MCLRCEYRVPGEGKKPRSGSYPSSPEVLEDAQRAIGLTRFHAAEWHIDPHKIWVMGFSAGGHMVAATKSEWVQHEIDGAMSRELDEKKVRLIPLLIGNVQSRDLPADIRGKNYLDFRVPDEAGKAFDRLVDFLKPELRIRGTHLKELRSGLPASKNPVHDLEEIPGEYGDQTLQRAALRGLEVIGTPEALLVITERMSQ